MRYRKLDADGDYVFGTHSCFLINSPEAVAQAVETRLRLWSGEWFLDTSDGTRWNEQVLGHRFNAKRYDPEIRRRILGTPGVTQISNYSSSFDGNSRELTITAIINTEYGTTTTTVSL